MPTRRSSNRRNGPGFGGGLLPLVSGPSVDPPAVPQNFEDWGSTATSVGVSYSASEGATSYDLRLGPSGGPYVAAAESPTTLLELDLTGLEEGTEYCVQVRARNAGGASAWSSELCLMTCPPVPANVTVDSFDGNSIQLSWDASSTATNYLVYRASSLGGPWTPVGDPVDAPATSFNNTGLASATQYCYQVAAGNDFCYSAFSAGVCQTTA